MKSKLLILVFAFAFIVAPGAAETPDVCTEAEELREKMMDKMEEASTVEEEQQIREEYSTEASSLMAECRELLQQDSSTHQQATPEDVIEWSEAFPSVSGTGPEAELTDEQLATVQSNLDIDTGEIEEQAPDYYDQECVERTKESMSDFSDRVQETDSVTEVYELSQRVNSELNEITAECRERYIEAREDAATVEQDSSPDRAVERSDRPQPDVVEEVERQVQSNIVEDAEDLIEWSEQYPNARTPGSIEVELTEEELETVKANLQDKIDNFRDHVPEQFDEECIEKGEEITSAVSEDLTPTDDIETVIDLTEEMDNEMNQIARECMGQQVAESGEEIVDEVPAPQPDDIDDHRYERSDEIEIITAGEPLTTPQAQELRQTFNDMQNQIQEYERRLEQQQSRIETLEAQLEDIRNGESETTGSEDVVERPGPPEEPDVEPLPEVDIEEETSDSSDEQLEEAQERPESPESDVQEESTEETESSDEVQRSQELEENDSVEEIDQRRGVVSRIASSILGIE